ncbi:MAG: PTS sugar transporter subunit IIC [Oscillospiraceae bacterium]|nr:PTS sugar transporter subunit IIC [Oscillospiraceae bacterium]
MDTIPFIAIVFLTLYVGIGQLDQISIQIGLYSPLFAGIVTGLVLGDLSTGLLVGGTLQLLTLGVATYGGATVPDFLSGSIMGTAFAIITGQGFEFGIALAVPIGMLLMQLDVFGRMTNVIFQHRADRAAARGNWRSVETSNMLGMIPWTLTRMIPVFVGLFFGETVVLAINDVIPVWLMAGLRYAGGILPAMGMALLMRMLPFKKFLPYYILGFVIMGYVAGITILGVSLVGLALALIYMARQATVSAATAGAVEDDDMEVEIDE